MYSFILGILWSFKRSIQEKFDYQNNINSDILTLLGRVSNEIFLLAGRYFHSAFFVVLGIVIHMLMFREH